MLLTTQKLNYTVGLGSITRRKLTKYPARESVSKRPAL